MPEQTPEERESADHAWDLIGRSMGEQGTISTVLGIHRETGADVTITVRLPNDTRALEVRFTDFGTYEEDE